MVGMMFQDFFSKKNLGMFLFFSPSNGSWFGGLGCVFVLSHPFCLFLSPTIPSLFQALSAVVSCPMWHVREFLGGVAESRPRTFSEAQLWTWRTTQDVILEMLGKLGVLKICLLSCKNTSTSRFSSLSEFWIEWCLRWNTLKNYRKALNALIGE